MTTTFTAEQLNALRDGFAGVDSIPLDKVSKFQTMMDGLGADALAQVAGARIKFLSPLALTRCGLLAACNPKGKPFWFDNHSTKQRVIKGNVPFKSYCS